MSFSILCHIWSKENHSFATFSPAAFSILHSTCPKESLWEIVFILKKVDLFFFSFPDIERKNIGFLSTCFWQDCQNCNLLANRNISRRKKFLLKLLSVFILVHWAKKFGLLAVFSRILSKLLSKFPKVEIEENSSSELSVFFFNRLWTLSKNLSAFVKKFSAGLSKLYSKCPQEKFDDFFSKKTLFQNQLRTRSGKLQPSVKSF